MTARRDLAAIVLAAGKGTRMRSDLPKLLHPLGGRPLIHYPLRAAREIGAARIVVVVGYGADAVEAVCRDFDVCFTLQEEQRGTGHAARCALPALEGFDGDVLIVNGDLPLLSAATLRAFVDTHRTSGATLSLLTARTADPSGFGRIVRENGHVARIVEERDASPAERRIDEVNVGIYCAGAAFLADALQRLEPNNAQGELYLTDTVEMANAGGGSVVAFVAPEAEVAQVNWRGELAQMEKTLRDRINRKWMEDGVTLVDPDTAYIEADVEIGRDTVIGPNVQLRGRTRIGARCRLDGTALLTDATIGDDVHLKFGVVIADSEIGPTCEVGPFAHVRADSRFAPGVAIGNFVETKKTDIGRGSKARHLTYLGDASIGEETNVGAGTITCNYDGFRKHRTVIGSRVMIGSDSQLVAPVTVGDDAYVATGTTVKKDVVPGALVFNPKTQLEREGWTERKRAQEGEAERQKAKGKRQK